jgi:hypothetical protein
LLRYSARGNKTTEMYIACLSLLFFCARVWDKSRQKGEGGEWGVGAVRAGQQSPAGLFVTKALRVPVATTVMVVDVKQPNTAENTYVPGARVRSRDIVTGTNGPTAGDAGAVKDTLTGTVRELIAVGIKVL